MKVLIHRYFILIVILFTGIISCKEDDSSSPLDQEENNNAYTSLLINQIDEVIIPSSEAYSAAIFDLKFAVDSFSGNISTSTATSMIIEYKKAYLAYQALAVHNYFANVAHSFVETTNLFPADTTLLANFIANKTYHFSTTNQQRANGFAALDYLLFGTGDVVSYFQADSLRLNFLKELVSFMANKALTIENVWKNDVQPDFIVSGGTNLGSSISAQLNGSLIYYEKRIREDKVGIPIGRLGPNDSPITPDATKIEAYYQSQAEGSESFTLSLLRAAIEEMEDIYLGRTSMNVDGQGYDDLLIERNQSSVDKDIKAQYTAIYTQINNKTSISGDDELYKSIQRLVSLYKSDLLPLLNVQDADGANDGD